MSYAGLSKYRSELMGVAMLWVMLFHAVDLEPPIPLFHEIRAAGFGGVDIFILLSAMGLAMSLDRREQEFIPFMARRARRILPAYYVVMVAYTLFSIARGTAPLSALIWNATLLDYWVHSIGAFNWYVSGIMLFYAITPFCFKKLKKAAHRELWVAAGVVLGLAVCHIMMADGYWNHMDFFYRVPIFLVGLLMGLYVREGRKLGNRGVLFWGLCLAAGAAYLMANHRYPDSIWFPLCQLFLLTTVPMCLILCLCFEKLPLGWLRKFLRLVGEHSLEIYLLNVSFFSERELLQRYLDFGPGHYVYYLITIPLNLALGVALHRAVEAGTARLGRPKS